MFPLLSCVIKSPGALFFHGSPTAVKCVVHDFKLKEMLIEAVNVQQPKILEMRTLNDLRIKSCSLGKS